MGLSCRCTTRSIRREVGSALRGDQALAPRAPAETPATPDGVPTVGGCPMFGPDSAWNRDVSNDPVDPRSAAYIANIAAHGPHTLHPDFGARARYGIPYMIVPQGTAPVTVRFDEYGDESDPGPYPIPMSAPIEAGRDHHVIVVEQGTCRLYELYHARRSRNGWLAGAGAVFDLRNGTQRPRGWTSCDQAGLPILPGLARRNEVSAGAIRHALRVTFDHTQDGWIAPANHPGGGDDRDSPPMGLRLRMKASYDLSGFTGQTRTILEALKRYGLIVADTGTNWFISGAPDAGWDEDDLDQLTRVSGDAFEVVTSGPIQRHP
jgi:hypothetical protein